MDESWWDMAGTRENGLGLSLHQLWEFARLCSRPDQPDVYNQLSNDCQILTTCGIVTPHPSNLHEPAWRPHWNPVQRIVPWTNLGVEGIRTWNKKEDILGTQATFTFNIQTGNGHGNHLFWSELGLPSPCWVSSRWAVWGLQGAGWRWPQASLSHCHLSVLPEGLVPCRDHCRRGKCGRRGWGRSPTRGSGRRAGTPSWRGTESESDAMWMKVKVYQRGEWKWKWVIEHKSESEVLSSSENKSESESVWSESIVNKSESVDCRRLWWEATTRYICCHSGFTQERKSWWLSQFNFTMVWYCSVSVLPGGEPGGHSLRTRGTSGSRKKAAIM